MAEIRVTHEQWAGLKDAKAHVDEYGNAVIFKIRQESNIDRDDYGTIKKRVSATTYTFKAFPVNYNPSRRRIEKAGLIEEVDVIIFTAMMDWSNNDQTFNSINITDSTVILGGAQYTIKEKGLSSMFGNDYLYISFGLRKR